MALTRDQINDFIREQVHPQAESLYKIKSAMLHVLDYVEVTGTTEEFIQDTIASTIIGGDRITSTYSDVAGTITLNVESNLSNYTNDVGFLTTSSNLSSINDISLTNLSTNQMLRYDGSNWININLSASDVSGLASFIETNSVVTANTAKVSYPGVGAVDHDSLLNYVANEHIDWTIDQGATNINEANIPNLRNANKLLGVNIDISVATPADGSILVYRSAGSDWVVEAKPAGGSVSGLADLTDVTVNSVADNEILGYDNTSGDWINQTAGELGLLTTSHSGDSTIHFTQSAITTVGTVSSGVWNGTAIQDAYISSAVTWNAKLSDITSENINDLSDVNIVTPSDGQVFTYNAGNWVNQDVNITEAQISDLQNYLLNISSESIADLSDVTLTTPSAGQFLKYGGSNWADSFINVSDITDLTATATELNYVDGVTSNIQTQLNNKANTSHNHTVSDITGLTATVTELNYTDGVTSSIQTQLNNKASSTHGHKGYVKSESGTSYTLSASDKTNIDNNVTGTIRTTNAAANTVTIPPDSTVNFDVGTIWNIFQEGTGQTEILAGAGVTLYGVTDGSSDYKIAAQYRMVSIQKLTANTWLVVGALAS